MRNPARLIKSSITGFILAINPLCLAIKRIPKIPIKLRFNILAAFLPGFSSMISKSAFNSMANAIASDSPGSISVFHCSTKAKLLTVLVSIQPRVLTSFVPGTS